MGSLRQRFLKWSMMRFLHQARRGLARDPTPERIRRDMARFDRVAAAPGLYTLASTVDLGQCKASWLEVGGEVPGRVILYLHGGAFVAESPQAHCAMLARICRRGAARGLYVTYRLAPEHPYPAASDDCFAGYRYLLDAGFDPAGIVIAGDSAGGNLAVVTAMRVRDAGLPPPAGMVLLSPVLDGSFSGDSMRRNDGLDPLFRRSVMQRLAIGYVDEGQHNLPYVSPLSGDVTGLPPSLVIVGSSEILLDDSVRFAGRAGNADLRIWHGMPHVFPVMPRLAESADALDVIAAFVAARTSE